MKRHESRKEVSTIMWQYGVIPANGTPFSISSSQELQCQYGSPRKPTAVKPVRFDIVTLATSPSMYVAIPEMLWHHNQAVNSKCNCPTCA